MREMSRRADREDCGGVESRGRGGDEGLDEIGWEGASRSGEGRWRRLAGGLEGRIWGM